MSFCSKRYQFATVLVLGIVISSGCSALPNSAKQQLPEEISADQLQNSPAKYYVEIHPAFGNPKLYTGTITEPTTVQKALELSGALKSVRSPVVDVHRMLPGGAPPLKLPVELKGKQVKYEQDYALHPNDRVIVRQKTSNTLDQIVDSLMPGN